MHWIIKVYSLWFILSNISCWLSNYIYTLKNKNSHSKHHNQTGYDKDAAIIKSGIENNSDQYAKGYDEKVKKKMQEGMENTGGEMKILRTKNKC